MKKLLPFITVVTLANGVCAQNAQKEPDIIKLPKPKLESKVCGGYNSCWCRMDFIAKVLG